MLLLVGMGAVLAGAVAAWFVAAFALRWRHDARCAATLLFPGTIATAVVLCSLVGDRGFPSDDVGWSIVFGIVSFMAGASASVMALPVWLVLEQRFGWRAP